MDDLAASVELETDPDVAYLRSLPTLRIVVGGWSASGKTVFAKYLAELLRCEYVSASACLLSALDLEAINWIRDRDQLVKQRTPEVERKLDKDLLAQLVETPRIILDSWAAAFLGDSHDVAVWIECGIDVRAQNAMGPDCPVATNPDTFRAVRRGLAQKDRDSVALFRDLYGFTYGPTPDVFEVYVDISQLISPDRERWWHERHSVLFLMVPKIRKHLG